MKKVFSRLVASAVLASMLLGECVTAYASEPTGVVPDSTVTQESSSSITSDESYESTVVPPAESEDEASDEIINESEENIEEEPSDESATDEADAIETEEVVVHDLIDDPRFQNIDAEDRQLLEGIKYKEVLGASASNVQKGTFKGFSWELKGTGSDSYLKINGKGALPNCAKGAFPAWYMPDDADPNSIIIPSVKKIIIGEGITSIGSYCFSFCTADEIILPSTLKSIGSKAFYGSELCKLQFQGDFPSIGADAFGCVSVVAYYPSDNKTYTPARLASAEAQFEYVSWVPVGGDSARSSSEVEGQCGPNIKWKYSGGTLSLVGYGDMYDFADPTAVPWFQYNKSIKTVAMDDRITSIGSYAFARSVSVVNSTSEFAYVTDRSASISFKSMPKALTTIGEGAFMGTTASLPALNVFKNVTTIGNSAFVDAEVSVPSGASTVLDLSAAAHIGAQAFMRFTTTGGNFQLKLGDNLTTLGTKAFFSANRLNGTVVLGGKLYEVPAECFYMTNIEQADIKGAVKRVNYNAFGANNSMKTLNIYTDLDYVGSTILTGYTTATVNFQGNVKRPQFDCDWADNVYVTINIYSTDASWKGFTKQFYNANNHNCRVIFVNNSAKITFDTTGHSQKLDPIIVEKGCTFGNLATQDPSIDGLPSLSTENGVKFRGWTEVKGGKSTISDNKVIDKDIVLYPIFDNNSKIAMLGSTGDVTVEIANDMGFKSEKDIPKGLWVYDKGNAMNEYRGKRGGGKYIYTGNPITISNARVFYGSVRLTEGIDYNISYKNNVKAGEATAFIKGSKFFNGTYVHKFTIVPLAFGDVDKYINVSYLNSPLTKEIKLNFNNKVQRPKVKITANIKKTMVLKENVDYVISYTDKSGNPVNIKEVGKYNMVITGKGNYSGVRKYGVEVVDKINISKCKVSLPGTMTKSDYVQDTTMAQGSTLVVKYKNKTLVNGKDYYVISNYVNGYSAMECTISAYDGSQFYGSIKRRVKLTGKSFAGVGVVLPSVAEIKTDSEQALQQKVSVYENQAAANKRDQSKLLPRTEGIYNVYSVSVKKDFKNNKAVFTIKPGLNSIYVGTKVVTVNMGLKKISSLKVDVPDYNGAMESRIWLSSGLKASQIVVTDGKKVVPSSEYECLYNVKPNGALSMRIMAKGINYYGDKVVTIGRRRVNIGDPTVGDMSVDSAVYIPSGAQPSVAAAVIVGDNITMLEPKKDYTVSYSNNKKVGKGKVTITGKGKYTGKIVREFDIKPNSAGITAAATNIRYVKKAGNYMAPIKVYRGKYLLKKGRDYDITYYYNGKKLGPKDIVPNKGQVTAEIVAKGNYIGKTKCTYNLGTVNLATAKVVVNNTEPVIGSISKTIKPSNVDVYVDGKKLPTSSYSVRSQTNNERAGTASLELYATGNSGFYGAKKVSYKIPPRDISK